MEELQSMIRQACKNQGVKRLDLFGSRARTNAMEGNDFDFLASFKEGSLEDYSKRFFGLLHELEDILDAPVDLLTAESLQRQSLRERIKKEGICVYGF